MIGSLALLLAECMDYESGETALDSLSGMMKLREGVNHWMLGRLVCVSTDLNELAELLSSPRPQTLRPNALLGISAFRAATAVNAWDESLIADATAMNEFDRVTPDSIEIAAYEIVPPARVGFGQVLTDLRGFAEIQVYVEVDGFEDLRESLVAFAECSWASVRSSTGPDLPTTAHRWAQVIRDCVSLDASFKLAGLREPVTKAEHIGLTNVVGAVCLAIQEDLPVRQIESILRDSDVTRWKFTDECVQYGEMRAGLESISSARDVLFSVGCASPETIVSGIGTRFAS